MNLILLGAPGAGKGTQAELLVNKLSIPAISTGNMLREAIANGTDLGKEAKKYMDEGGLVPDDLILGIVAERVAQPDCKNGFILDGVPRTIAQAEAMEQAGIRFDAVVALEVPDEKIVERMVEGRIEKYYKEVCLMEQPFVKDPDKTIRDLISEATVAIGEKISVRRFVRFERGEGIEKRADNFADEVASMIK